MPPLRLLCTSILLAVGLFLGCDGEITINDDDPAGDDDTAGDDDVADDDDAADDDTSDDDTGDDDSDEEVWQAFLDAREDHLLALAEPIAACVSAYDTGNPVFHGCVDWHSAVHGTWSLLAISRITGDPWYAEIADAQLTDEAVAGELAQLEAGGWLAASEIPYGYAWFLTLAREREDGGADDLVPLAEVVTADLEDHLFGLSEARPAATMVVVPSLLDPAWLLEMEAEAWLGEVAGEECEVRPTTDEDRAWIAERSEEIFNGDVVISRGVAHRPADLPGFVAWRGDERVGLATYLPEGKVCELVTIAALVEQQGVGTALLAAVENAAREVGCRALWLVTTNDNLGALRFYQRRGFVLAELHAGALERSRELKPAIPRVGEFGIPMNDELLLDKEL